MPTPHSASIDPSGLRVFPLSWHCPAAVLGTRQHSWQELGLSWSCSRVDKLGLLKPTATSTVSSMVPPLCPGRTVSPATVPCPSYLDTPEETSTLKPSLSAI